MTKSRGIGKGNPGKVMAAHGPLFEIEHRGFELNGYASACWIWKRYVKPAGYGEWKPFKGQVRSSVAHRAVFEMANGLVPKGLDLDHLCRMRCCVRPDHLEPVTRKENAQRGLGTKLTAENIYDMVQLRKRGMRNKEVARLFHIDPFYLVKIYARHRHEN